VPTPRRAGENQALDQELANQPATGRPSDARGPSPFRGTWPREEEIGDVRAGDEEEQRDRGGERRERLAGTADDVVDPAHGLDDELAAFGIVAG
jgi:hypothetical protein